MKEDARGLYDSFFGMYTIMQAFQSAIYRAFALEPPARFAADSLRCACIDGRSDERIDGDLTPHMLYRDGRR